MDGRCGGCGLEIDGGTEGCRAEFERLIARDFGDVRFGRVHRLLVDVYSLQHPDRYCLSAKSLAAHLTGLCCALELGANPAVYRALQRWLNGESPVEKPSLPEARGALTVACVRDLSDPDPYADAVDRWARATWQAYEPLQPLACAWVAQALRGR